MVIITHSTWQVIVKQGTNITDEGLSTGHDQSRYIPFPSYTHIRHEVLLAYRTTAYFQWGLSENDQYTLIHSE